jgi:phage/plasmid-associated DNA primase
MSGEYVQKLANFVGTLRATGKDPYTHTTKVPMGKYYINADNQDKFMILYQNAIVKKAKLCWLESPSMYAPLRVDCDFKHPMTEDGEITRKYTADHIASIVGMYQTEIEQILAVESDIDRSKVCVVLEKSIPRQDGDTIKDGFHLHFINFICESWLVEYLRERVSKKMVDAGLWDDIDLITPVAKIIDSNIGSKTWLMYGSAKDLQSEPYLVERILDKDLNEISIEEAFAGKLPAGAKNPKYYLPSMLSVRGFSECTPISPAVASNNVPKKRRKILVNKTKSDAQIMADVKIIEDGEIMDMLSDDRADDYNEWMYVGYTLFDITQGSDKGLELWDAFSKRSPKYGGLDTDVAPRWGKMKMHNKSLATLYWMAKKDSPEKWEEYRKTNINAMYEKIFSEPKPNETSVARLVHKMYAQKFVCADAKHNKWYEFREHRWREMDSKIPFRQLLINEFTDELYSKRKALAEKSEQDKDNRKDINFQIDIVNKVISKMGEVSFLKKVCDQSELFFHDPQFEKRRDENRNLWGCENGVIDFENGVFRDGSPDDYITMSCGIVFEKPSAEDIEEYEEYISKVLPNKNRRKYMLDMITLACRGQNVMKKIIFMTGETNGGKSKYFEMIEVMGGDYVMKFPRELFVGRGNSSGSARPEMARVRGKRIAGVSELTKMETMNIGVLKELTGNDSFYARTLFEKGAEIKPQITMFPQCNDPPKIPGQDKATWGRVRDVLFESTFDINAPKSIREQIKKNHFPPDPYLSEKIPTFAQVMLWEVFQNSIRLGKTLAIVEPKEVMEVTLQYQRKNDIYLAFFEDRLEKINKKGDDNKDTLDEQGKPVPDDSYSMRIKEIHDAFNIWYKRNHPDYFQKDKIDKDTMRNGLEKYIGKPQVKGKQIKWIGLRFYQEEDDEAEFAADKAQ